MESYDRDYLRETVREMVVKYEMKKALENKEALKEKIDTVAKEITKIFVDEMLKEEGIKWEYLGESERKAIEEMIDKEVIPYVKKGFGLERLEERLEEYIRKEIENRWYFKLEDFKEVVESEISSTKDEELKKALSDGLSRLEKIIKFRESIIDELTKIAKERGIIELEKNLDELMPYAIRKVLPTPEDRRNFIENLEKLHELYFEKLLGFDSKSLKYLESLGWEGRALRRVIDYYKTLYIDPIKKAYSLMTKEVK